MKKYFILFISFLVICTSSIAGKISGRVTDKKTGDPLAFATISVKGSERGTNANNNSFYSLTLPPGTYTLICQYVGYKKEEKSITVTDADITVNFELSQQDENLEMVTVSTKSDYGYEIIKNAIAKRKEHGAELKKFTSEVYTKGNLKVRNYPKKVFGQKVDFADGDTSKQKMIYLSETVSNYSVDENGKEKTEVISSKVSGQPDAYGLSNPQFFSF